MTFWQAQRRRVTPLAILAVVGAIGLLITLWVSWSLERIEQERLEQRFQVAASARAAEVISVMREPLEQLAILQRLFASVDDVDWPTFKRFTDPMLKYPGVRSYSWYPRVVAATRTNFERDARKLWGPGFAIADRNAQGANVRAAGRAFHFPLLFAAPEALARKSAGFDIYQPRAELIDRAIGGGVPTASAIGSLAVDPRQTDAILLFAPVYGKGEAPLPAVRWRDHAAGIVVAILSFDKLFAAATTHSTDTGLNVRLLDLHRPPEARQFASWESRLVGDQAAIADKTLVRSESFALGSHSWAVEIEASPAWVEANRPRGVRYVLPVGVLVVVGLLLYLSTLLGRSALADSLEIVHEDDLKQRQATELWANKLALAVEQNPAAIVITDLEGRTEYVNDKFVETSGYARAEVVGQLAGILRPQTAAAGGIYRELWETIKAGHTWRGELQNERRDGTLYWERVLISPIKDQDGVVRNFVAIKENITELREAQTRLQESESRFRGAMSVMAEGLVIVSPEGNYLFGNRVAERFLGDADGVHALNWPALGLERIREDGSLCPPEEFPLTVTLREQREVRDFVMGFRPLHGERALSSAPDDVRWLQFNTMPLALGEGQRPGVVMTFSDVTERRRAGEQLKLAYEAIKHSGEGILVTSADQTIISVNPAFEIATGYSADEVVGRKPDMIASGRHDAAFHAEMQATLNNVGHWQGEVWSQRKNGEIFPEWLGVSVVRGSDGSPQNYVYIYSDMSERLEAQRRIELLAHHDPLTGLPNRLLLRDRVEQAKAQAARMQSRVALMYLDLDRFKTINDSLGHPAGDALLKEVVERLKSCVRESDTISRQGGDEFIVLLNDVREHEAVTRVADKIHQRMAEPLVIGNHLLNTSFSIGVALYPDDGDDFDTLLQKSDTAMYHAKEAGRNGHRFFTESMNRQVVEHLTLETQLRRAIENREFVLHYQPQLDLHDGSIVGVEALIRWNHPENGLIEPGKFIPVAEVSGLIVAIGAWVLNEACRQARAWQDAGLPPFVMAVNLSAVQFRRLDLVTNVINALVLSDLDSQWLELELTESILIQDAESTLDSVRRLKALGVKLSVDDFGTGYSSLAYLKRFAVDKLKIDKSFIRELVVDPDDAAIVRAIIQMARSLKLKTIAEGVESEELANLLRVFHCDEVQGYWFARPMVADDLEAFVRAHAAVTA